MDDDTAIAAEIQAARHYGREISDGCARAIASQYMDGPLGASFATSGAIGSPSGLWCELFLGINPGNGNTFYQDMDLPGRTAADMLGTYLVRAGVRGPQPGWSETWVR